MDARKGATKINDCFTLANEISPMVQQIGAIRPARG